MWLAILAISGCGHGMAWKESVSLAPDKIAGRQLEYTDSHGVNIYTFFTGGRYRYATLSQNRSYADSREGSYEYERTGKKTGTIRFENEPSIRLIFTGPQSAVGRVDADERVYRFLME
jgi:hypothetical protein